MHNFSHQFTCCIGNCDFFNNSLIWNDVSIQKLPISWNQIQLDRNNEVIVYKSMLKM